jgi:hypothetical protein
MTTSPLEDPRRALEIRVAYLRLGLRDGGISIGTKGGHAMSDQLRGMIGQGDMAIMRPDRSTNRLISRVHTTPQGIERLAGYDERYGEDFGAPSTIPTLRSDETRAPRSKSPGRKTQR